MTARWIVRFVLSVAVLSQPALAVSDRDAKVFAVLDQYMNALNALDLESHVDTYRFPHFRLASGSLSVWNSPGEAMPLLNVPAQERREQLRRVLGDGWVRSVWTRRDIVQEDSQKVHVVTRFERLRADDSLISAHESLYILTERDGRWAIQGRSSFAP